MKLKLRLRSWIMTCVALIVSWTAVGAAPAGTPTPTPKPTAASRNAAGVQAATTPSFSHHVIDPSFNMGGTSWGAGISGLGDLDRDGDLDHVVGTYQGSNEIAWYENVNNGSSWTKHIAGTMQQGGMGCVIMDVDGDGWPDVVGNGQWFKNPGSPRTQQFTRYVYGLLGVSHDITAADIDNDGKRDIAVQFANADIYWYKIPADPTGEWPRHFVAKGGHGTIGPGGVGDIDGDGDNDIITAFDTWYENVNNGSSWIAHSGEIPWPDNHGVYGTAVRTIIYDMNKDDKNDIIIADCDAAPGSVAWLQNNGGGSWTTHMIKSGLGDLHSLALFDYDKDGDMDVFVGEMEDGPSANPGAKGYIFENVGGYGSSFTQYTISSGIGYHEAAYGDVDGDGDIDICSKNWNTESPRSVVHVDYFRNDTATGPRLGGDRDDNSVGRDRPFGESIGLGVKFSQGQPQRDLALLKDLGVRWVRDGHSWSRTEPVPGRYEFQAAFKERLAFYRQNNIGIVFLLAYDNRVAYPPPRRTIRTATSIPKRSAATPWPLRACCGNPASALC